MHAFITGTWVSVGFEEDFNFCHRSFVAENTEAVYRDAAHQTFEPRRGSHGIY